MIQVEKATWVPGLFGKLIALAILSVLTTTANILMVYITFQTKSLVSNTKVFFGSLCFAHLIGSLIVIPSWIIIRLSPNFAQESNAFCRSVSFFWILMILTSFYSLSALSLDRFFIISNPMRYPIWATTLQKLAAVAMLWIICILISAAPIIGWGEYTFMPDAIPICGLNMKDSFSFTLFLIIAGFILPLLIDILCCGRIISIARRQSRCMDLRRSSDGTSSITSGSTESASSASSSSSTSAKMSKLKQKLNSLRLVFAGTGSFLVCWLPYVAAHIWMTNVRNISHSEESMPYILEFVVMCIALLNGFINPVVLMLSNRDHRREIRSLILRRLGLSSADDRGYSSSESITVHTRRAQFRKSTLSQTFQTIQELQFEVDITPATPTESHQLQKKDSDTSILDIAAEMLTPITTQSNPKMQLQFASDVNEAKRLMSPSSQASIDIESPLESFKVDLYLQLQNREIVASTIDKASEILTSTTTQPNAKMQLRFASDVHEARRLMSQSSQGSVDIDTPLENVKVEFHAPRYVTQISVESIVDSELDANDDPKLDIK
ncbi:histamine H2 receptor-like [Dreissena polymorpha]|nr:histamine H2 receptor-like [Dreissena polymorpha]